MKPPEPFDASTAFVLPLEDVPPAPALSAINILPLVQI
jgi:hypothetical protein